LKQSQKDYKRIVIKIGSSLFCEGNEIKMLRLFDIVSIISDLVKEESKEITIVSSGAIALGMNLMKMKARPKDISTLQALAAVGQSLLMENYSSALKKHGMDCAQVLLTWDDFDSRKRYLNAKNTLLKLLKLGVVPVVNENDTISSDEIRFGDNDRLSALVATLINADLLIILSDVEGLLDTSGNVVRVVAEINAQVRSLAVPTQKKSSVGGMVTKIDAAKIATDSGIPCVIAKGAKGRILFDIARNPEAGGAWTLFASGKGCLAARERWIAFGTKPKGKIIVDEGAKKALLDRKSLLSVGVMGIEGVFDSGDIVSIIDQHKLEIARGKVGLSSRQLDKAKGSRLDKEVIHRDNMVIL
jgi:glutamate 5-kinase